MENYQNDAQAVEAFGEKYKKLTTEVGKVIVGQDLIVKDVLILFVKICITF